MRVALALGLETLLLVLLLVAWTVFVGCALEGERRSLRVDPQLALLIALVALGLQYVLVLSLLGV